MKDGETMDPEQWRHRLSALVDGELDDAGADQACRDWRSDAAVRADWHAYHLIGELMRSDQTRCRPAHDAHFLDGLRQRLASDAGAMAATPFASPQARAVGWYRAWSGPMAVAAGFVAVAGVLAVTRLSAPDAQVAPSSVLSSASVPGTAAAGPAQTMAGEASAPGVVVVDGKLMRNAELDRYLAAHKEFGGASALAVPGEILRSSAAAAPGR